MASKSDVLDARLPVEISEKKRAGLRAASTRWRKKNLKRKSELAVEYGKRHPEKMNARNAARRALKKSRIAPWADNAKMLAFYRRARELTKSTGIVHDVDHIVPLKHEKVSGLHVPANLQVITGAENMKKNSKYEIDE